MPILLAVWRVQQRKPDTDCEQNPDAEAGYETRN